ncbi:hypothetical protein HID58_072444 [Brassica napus]|uniref:Uncharacterized protein n=1 Tax=Brassica napus TaxID=3708 RepID=A0ABQ7Z4E9_BRANA|nr:hypothetical protein HID58_072444 [Brassica napus]
MVQLPCQLALFITPMLCWPFWCQTTLLRSRAVSSSVSAKTTFMVLVYAGKLLLPSLCALLNNYTPPTALIISFVLFLTISPPDSAERFHISAFLVSVLERNILEAEGPWFGNFIYIDIIKHSFLAKFNGIRPITYYEFLQALCEQLDKGKKVVKTLRYESHHGRHEIVVINHLGHEKVIRVLTPVYVAHLPYSPLPWKVSWMVLLSVITYIMLTSLKVLIGM